MSRCESVLTLDGPAPLGTGPVVGTTIHHPRQADRGLPDPRESETLRSPYAERRAIPDEAIAIVKELWRRDDPSSAEKYSCVSGMPCTPKPLQQPHIPVVIGGNGRAVIRCTVQLGKEWHSPVVPPERLDQSIDELQVHAQAASRTIAEIPV